VVELLYLKLEHLNTIAMNLKHKPNNKEQNPVLNKKKIQSMDKF